MTRIKTWPQHLNTQTHVLALAGLVVILIAAQSNSYAQGKTKQKIIYRTHTDIDFSGQTVQGRIRAPEVFYIFQRKRASGHSVITPPENLDYHKTTMLSRLKGGLPR